MAYRLNNGQLIPDIALGTYKLNQVEEVRTILRAAIQEGYRHFDLAHVYGNEKVIGDTLKELFDENLIKREDLFLTSKLWNTFHDHVDLAIDTTLKNLQIEYLDLYLIHWPVFAKPDTNFNEITDEKNDSVVLNPFNLEKVWVDMERQVENRKTRSIGVSNFGVKNLTKLLNFCKIKPVCLQIEIHPFLKQQDLVRFCQQHDIVVEAYAILRCLQDVKQGKGPALTRIADKYKCSVATVITNYLLSKKIVPIAKTATPERLQHNLKRIELTDEDVKTIDNIKETKRYVEGERFGPARFD